MCHECDGRGSVLSEVFEVRVVVVVVVVTGAGVVCLHAQGHGGVHAWQETIKANE